MDKAVKVGLGLAGVTDLSVQGTAKVFLFPGLQRVAGAVVTCCSHHGLAVVLLCLGWHSRAGGVGLGYWGSVQLCDWPYNHHKPRPL